MHQRLGVYSSCARLPAHLPAQFDTVDILDDVVDHWDAGPHKTERKLFVHMLQVSHACEPHSAAGFARLTQQHFPSSLPCRAC